MQGLFNVRERGATGQGVALETPAIQAAADACAQAGGGTVYFPPGRYLTGTIELRSNVTLHLEAGAVLLGSRDLKDYPVRRAAFRSYTDNYTDKSLLYAFEAENVGLAGPGEINGQGSAFSEGAPYMERPYLVRFVQCRNVRLSDVTLRNSAMWVCHFLACEDVAARGVRIRSRVNQNNDGFDIDCSERVRISDCDIWSGDDAIVLKSTANRQTKDVVVSNCVLSSLCNALKMGTETNGGFDNVAISNCTIYDTELAGVALEIVDGGALDRVTVSNIVMRSVNTPLFLRLGNRARPYEKDGRRPGVGKFHNVLLSNIDATASDRTGCAISGIPGHFIENVTFDNVRLRFPGGGTAADAARLPPELEDAYPEHNMFGVLPAYGFYCRHARNLRFRNVEVPALGREERPAMICEDVEGLQIEGSDLKPVRR